MTEIKKLNDLACSGYFKQQSKPDKDYINIRGCYVYSWHRLDSFRLEAYFPCWTLAQERIKHFLDNYSGLHSSWELIFTVVYYQD